ncbi:MAG: protein translocase subunit SecF [Fusobacterium sp.]|nr:protein translocase subunit SecF [Fusobacterium sp.]
MKVDLKVIKHSKIYLGVATVAVIISVMLFLIKGLNYGIDFSGGNLIQIHYNEKQVDLSTINNNLDELSSEISQLSRNSRKVQISDDGTIIIRVQEIKENEKREVLKNLKKIGTYTLDKEEKVGASIGADLKKSAIYSLIIGSILIVLYITFRFEFSFAIGGILSLIHDISVAIGGLVLLGYEIDTPFIAAILTILGYSINDTIVIYDRIRENLKRRKDLTLEECMDNSVNQTAIRSLNTSLTTLLAIIAILVFGGASLKTFIVTLLIGVLAGTYSSIFIATPLVYFLNKNKKEKFQEMFKEKEEKEREEKILV